MQKTVAGLWQAKVSDLVNKYQIGTDIYPVTHSKNCSNYITGQDTGKVRFCILKAIMMDPIEGRYKL